MDVNNNNNNNSSSSSSAGDSQQQPAPQAPSSAPALTGYCVEVEGHGSKWVSPFVSGPHRETRQCKFAPTSECPSPALTTGKEYTLTLKGRLSPRNSSSTETKTPAAATMTLHSVKFVVPERWNPRHPAKVITEQMPFEPRSQTVHINMEMSGGGGVCLTLVVVDFPATTKKRKAAAAASESTATRKTPARAAKKAKKNHNPPPSSSEPPKDAAPADSASSSASSSPTPVTVAA